MIHIYNSRVSSCAESLIISCWFFEHKNVVMLPKIFCSHQKPTLLTAAWRCLLRSRRQWQATSRSFGKCQHGATQCPPVLQEERLFVIFAPEVGGILYRVWWMVEWWCNYKYPGTDHVLRNNCDTDNTWLQSVNVRRRLPANFRGISSSIGQQHINTICSSQHKMIIMTCRGPHYLDFLHYHGVRGTENELYYV